MNKNLPTKTSSRAGRFKKKLVSEQFLDIEAPLIESCMLPMKDLYLQGKISSAELTGIYIITVLAHRFPGTWPGAKRPQPILTHHNLSFPLENLRPMWEPNVQRRLANVNTLGDVFNYFALQATPLSVNRAMLNWSTGHYGLELMFRIPKPQEVLNQQKQGRRCVTLVMEKEKARKFILGERDALGFAMHDLIHADHFYHDNQCYKGQLGFYGLLDHCLGQNHFFEHLENPQFESEFEYLISDMNAYAVHLMKCFKSALLHYHKDGESFFTNWLKLLNLVDCEKEALNSLNTDRYHENQDEILLNLLNRYENATSHREIN